MRALGDTVQVVSYYTLCGCFGLYNGATIRARKASRADMMRDLLVEWSACDHRVNQPDFRVSSYSYCRNTSDAGQLDVAIVDTMNAMSERYPLDNESAKSQS